MPDDLNERRKRGNTKRSRVSGTRSKRPTPVPLELSHEPSMMVNYDVPGIVQVRLENKRGLGPVKNYTRREWSKIWSRKSSKKSKKKSG